MAEYIDRSAVVSALISVENRYNRNRDHENVSAEALYKDLCDAEIEIGKIPAAEAAPVVHGRWGLLPVSIRSVKKTNIPEAVCSICGERFCDITNSVSLYRFCPNCGAKMDMG